MIGINLVIYKKKINSVFIFLYINMIAVVGNRLNRTSFLLMEYEWNWDKSILSERVDLSFKGLNWWNKGMLLMSTFAMEIPIE